jgi:polyhydroxybutyrate depolymerase
MSARSLRGSAVACYALGTALVTLACGSSTSDGTHGGGGKDGSPALGSGGFSATPGSGGGSGAPSGVGGSSAVGGAGGSTGGTGGDSAGVSGGAGTPAAAGTAGSTSAGSGGASSSGGSSGDAAGGVGGSSAGNGANGANGGGAGTPGSGGAGLGGSGSVLAGAVPSTGCGMAAPATGALQIDVGGTTRDYILRLPDGYDPSTPHRIIFAFHGMQGSADQVDKGDPPNTGLDPTGPYFGIKDLSTDTLFVAGQALSGGWTNSNGRDLDYVKALLSQLEGQACIDQSRVFATGFSFGAIMTITIACNMADVFRAVAPMSGSLQNGCPASDHSIAYWASHGTMDTTIDISLGEAARDEFVTRNKCQTTTVPSMPDGCVAYQGCADGYPVNWCPFDGIHQPPPFSGPAIWAFLSQF